MVVFQSGPTRSKYARNSMLAFSTFAPAVRHDRESIGSMRWQGNEPIALYQARKAVEMATEAGVDRYDEKSMREARTTLAQATNSMGSGGSSRVVTDYSRRTMELVTVAARSMYKAQQEKAEAEAAAKRKAELNALSQRTASAEQSAAAADAARRQAEEASQRADQLRSQAEMEKGEAERAKAEMAAAAAALAAQKSDLEAQMAALAAEKDAAEKAKADSVAAAAALDAQKRELEMQMAALAVENDKTRAERDALAQRLVGALATVAETQNTARGVVVSLSDILFDTNKATLKPDAQLALAKLTGVLSVFPNLNLRIEGYTDSTGTDAINNKLSRDRAASVVEFLQSQGIAGARITSEGYGSKYPVASNDTREGKSKNRRVQVVLAEGVIAAPTQ
jgi:outer membrane protein OmpA-like peptidoglycan-associated protein